MSHASPERLGPASSLNDERLAALRALAPELFTSDNDGVNADNVLAYFGLADQPRKRESFGLDWVGKHAAIMAAGLPATHTLVPEELANSQNLIIEGDNLEVLRILRKSYANKIKLIYIDPPYNTGNDFVYPDNFATHANDYLRSVGAINAEGVAQSVNTRSDGRFHAKWLSMMYPRLVLARELLRDDGVIFVSIDDNEVHNLRTIMNEVFGEENFVASIVWQKKFSPQNDATYMSDMHDYVIVYAKKAKTTKNEKVGFSIDFLPRTEEQNSLYQNRDNDSRGIWMSDNLTVKSYSAQYDYPITTPSGRSVKPTNGRCWVVSRQRFEELVADNRIWFGEDGGNVPRLKRFLSEVQDGVVPTTWWTYQEGGHNQEAKQELKRLFPETDDIFDTPKPVKLLKRILDISLRTDKTAIAMDFFAGSGTLGQAVLEYNAQDDGQRQFILVQEGFARQATARDARITFPTIAAFTRERVRRAAAKIRSDYPEFTGDLRFSCYKLAPSHLLDIPKQVVSDQAQITSFLFPDRLVPQWTPDGLYTELLLREGFILTTPFTTVGDWRVYVHDNGVALYINVALKTSATELLRVLEARDRDGKRKRNGVAICLDGALTDAELQHLHEHVFLKTV